MSSADIEDRPFLSTWDELEGQMASPLAAGVCRERLWSSPHRAKLPHPFKEEFKLLRWTNIGAGGLQTAVYCDVFELRGGGSIIEYRVGAERLDRFGEVEGLVTGGAMMVLGLILAAVTRSWFILIWVAVIGLILWGRVLQARGSRIGVKGDGAYLLSHIAGLVEARREP